MIGAGAAGLTLARELAGSKLAVCVLESGDRLAAPVPDPLYHVHSSALVVAQDSRVRAFGGTTTVWSGRWKHFDEIDLEPRDWVAGSGWPITFAALQPYRARADAAAGIAPATPVKSWFRSDALVPTVFATQPAARRDWGAGYADAPNVGLHLGAHVLRIERRGTKVQRIHVRDARGDWTIEPRVAVVAAGGIENARLLLLSELGNPHDQVGRYYMDHPKLKLGVVETYDPLERSAWDASGEDAPSYLGFRLADAVQREHRVLNSHVLFQPLFERDLVRRVVRRARLPASCRLLSVRNYLEQQPEPDNRVRLHDELDPLGLRKAAVHWTLGELDRRTMVVFHEVLRRELQRARIGELDSPLLRGGNFDEVGDASHHMGTTRMGSDPRSSVVDAHCRVHDVDNLFMAGSSVFPTSGYANPTATIAALAIRLADHLKELL
ncbi:MAG: GMC family oxidoreductase [Deltaproteobacteria bacterium]|nr:GMC family oxidoreductase [Deltaproteobacteria bacterium]